MKVIKIALSIFSFIISIEILVLLFFAIFIFTINTRRVRKLMIFYIILINLVLNSILLIFSIFNGSFKSNFNISLSNGALTVIELIYIFGLILVFFSRSESNEYESEKISDSFMMIIISCLIGSVITMNLISFISCFLIEILLIGVIFFIADHKKEFNLLKFYFIGSIFTITCLVLSTAITFLETNTLLLNDINKIEFSGVLKIFLSFIFIIGIGVPLGMFPFFIYHLRNYFQNTSYTYLFLYSLFNYISAFSVFKFLQIFTFSLIFNVFILFLLSSLSLLIVLFYIITELFTTLDGNTFSIKKLFGYSVVSDFNIFILISSLIALNNLGENSIYIENLIFFLLIIIFNKFLIYYSFYPLMLETYEDNLKLLGNFWTKYKIFGRILFISGIFLIFPLSFSGSFNILQIYNLDKFMTNSLLKLIATLAFSLFIIYIFVNLISISIIYIKVYFNKKPEYQEKADFKEVSNLYFLPIPILLALILTFTILFLFGNNIIYNWFENFLLLSGS